jgi:hypothetical protein
MYRLTQDQSATLLQIVRDESGDHLTRPAFTEAMLKLFEDIAGFETLPVPLRRKYLKLLWLRYEIACRSPARSR